MKAEGSADPFLQGCLLSMYNCNTHCISRCIATQCDLWLAVAVAK